SETQGDVVAIGHRVVVTTEVVGVGKAGGIGIQVDGIQPQADGLGAFVEAGLRPVAVDVMGPGQTGLELDAIDHIAVLPDRANPVTPGGTGGKAVIGAV